MKRGSGPAFWQELELRGTLRDDASSRLVQPIETRVESRITGGLSVSLSSVSAVPFALPISNMA